MGISQDGKQNDRASDLCIPIAKRSDCERGRLATAPIGHEANANQPESHHWPCGWAEGNGGVALGGTGLAGKNQSGANFDLDCLVGY
jgi:hypothetical protein